MKVVRLFSSLILSSLLCPHFVLANDSKMVPAPLLLLDDTLTHHVIIAEKSEHKVHLFKNVQGEASHVRSFQAATGKRKGNKLTQGDLKTPEGIYSFTQFLSQNDLGQRYGRESRIYGAGAFVMDYPNPFDRMNSKGGGGIWLHSTDDNSRVGKGLDSRGCVVVVDEDLKEISKYLELTKTPIIVLEDLHYLPQKKLQKQRRNLEELVYSWKEAWQNEDLKSYLSYYSSTDFRDPIRGSYPSFKAYKRRVFRGRGSPEIGISKLSLVRLGNQAVAKFIQSYKSNSIHDTGKKTLYLKLDNNYEWRIVSEVWQRLPSESKQNYAFVPSLRFFKD